jgi:hypothetical protein
MVNETVYMLRPEHVTASISEKSASSQPRRQN